MIAGQDIIWTADGRVHRINPQLRVIVYTEQIDWLSAMFGSDVVKIALDREDNVVWEADR
jgi:hypothetical protein